MWLIIVKRAAILSVVLCLLSLLWGTSANAQDDAGPVDLNHRYVLDWLVLGPIPRDQPLESPVETLGTPAAGQEVLLPSGEKVTWEKIRAGRDGIVRLDDLCRRREVFANHVIFYAFAELTPPVKPRCQRLRSQLAIPVRN